MTLHCFLGPGGPLFYSESLIEGVAVLLPLLMCVTLHSVFVPHLRPPPPMGLTSQGKGW